MRFLLTILVAAIFFLSCSDTSSVEVNPNSIYSNDTQNSEEDLLPAHLNGVFPRDQAAFLRALIKAASTDTPPTKGQLASIEAAYAKIFETELVALPTIQDVKSHRSPLRVAIAGMQLDIEDCRDIALFWMLMDETDIGDFFMRIGMVEALYTEALKLDEHNLFEVNALGTYLRMLKRIAGKYLELFIYAPRAQEGLYEISFDNLACSVPVLLTLTVNCLDNLEQIDALEYRSYIDTGISRTLDFGMPKQSFSILQKLEANRYEVELEGTRVIVQTSSVEYSSPGRASLYLLFQGEVLNGTTKAGFSRKYPVLQEVTEDEYVNMLRNLEIIYISASERASVFRAKGIEYESLVKLLMSKRDRE